MRGSPAFLGPAFQGAPLTRKTDIVRTLIQLMMSSCLLPGHVPAAEDKEMKPHALMCPFPIPTCVALTGVHWSAVLPS